MNGRSHNSEALPNETVTITWAEICSLRQDLLRAFEEKKYLFLQKDKVSEWLLTFDNEIGRVEALRTLLPATLGASEDSHVRRAVFASRATCKSGCRRRRRLDSARAM